MPVVVHEYGRVRPPGKGPPDQPPPLERVTGLEPATLTKKSVQGGPLTHRLVEAPLVVDDHGDSIAAPVDAPHLDVWPPDHEVGMQ